MLFRARNAKNAKIPGAALKDMRLKDHSVHRCLEFQMPILDSSPSFYLSPTLLSTTIFSHYAHLMLARVSKA